MRPFVTKGHAERAVLSSMFNSNRIVIENIEASTKTDIFKPFVAVERMLSKTKCFLH